MLGKIGFYTLACDYFFILKNPQKFHEYINKITKSYKVENN